MRVYPPQKNTAQTLYRLDIWPPRQELHPSAVGRLGWVAEAVGCLRLLSRSDALQLIEESMRVPTELHLLGSNSSLTAAGLEAGATRVSRSMQARCDHMDCTRVVLGLDSERGCTPPEHAQPTA